MKRECKVNQAIVVVEGGFVFVGEVYDQHEQSLTFGRSAIVRRWGTTKGVGELEHGPLTRTVLDPLPEGVRLNSGKIIFQFQCQGFNL